MISKIEIRAPYLLLTALTLVLDRITKQMILSRFGLYDGVTVIDGFFNITYVQNTGVAFGIFSSGSSAAKSAVLVLFTLGATAAIVAYSFRVPAGHRAVHSALGLMLGGALGNLYDRLQYGFVVDFLEFHIGRHYWPTFNLADSAITVGVLLLAMEMFRHEVPARA